MENFNHSAILTRLKDGGTEELSRLFMAQRANLRRLIDRRLHTKVTSRLDASDIVQEVFLRANHRLRGYLDSPTLHPVVWLRQLSKQILVEVVRKQFRDKRTPMAEFTFSADNEIADCVADSISSVDDQMVREEKRARVQVVLEELAIADREILEMRHADGYTFREIGDQLEITMEAAKKRYYRALERFRKAADEGFEPH